MTKVVWLPNETDYSYSEFVAPNTPYYSTFAFPSIMKVVWAFTVFQWVIPVLARVITVLQLIIRVLAWTIS